MSTSPTDWKAIRFPSGDHAGREPKEVSCRGGPPPAGTIQIPPFADAWYAISLPSGDHAGWTFWAPSEVIRTGSPAPDTGWTWISNCPVRSDANTIRLPSGESDASVSSPREVVI